MWKVVFPKRLFDELDEFLFSVSPRENGCFLSTSYSIGRGHSALLVTGVLKPDRTSWNRMGDHALEPSSAYINNCVVNADSKSEGLIFVHTHPNTNHPATFSIIDEETNERIFTNLSQILPDKPLGSLVFSKQGMHGVVYADGRIHTIMSYVVSGSSLSEKSTVTGGTQVVEIENTHDRQVRALGKDGQRRLQELRIAVVGVGGTGSSVAVQLARMGVKKLVLIDKDTLDGSNTSRVYGSQKGDEGSPKVEVLERHIKTFAKTEVKSIPVDVIKSGNPAIAEMIGCDVIFGCTDNLASRAVLNDVSLQYHIPLIDVGCRIDMNGGSIRQAVSKIQLVSPDHACLWCTGTLDGKLILQESFSDEEKRKLENEGYYQHIDKQPSIVSLTTMAASLGVNKLLCLLGAYGQEYSSKTQIELMNGFMIEETPEIKQDCVCQKRRGKGDLRRIV